MAKILEKGLTFADVLLVPKKTPLDSRSQADTTSRFTKNISLSVPLVSSNMASVTEHKTAIALAREGGIGVIHQFMPIAEQCAEVRKVKKSTSYIIKHPVTIPPETTIQEAVDRMAEEGVTGLLVTENQGLRGIFTSRDYLFEKEYSKPVSAVMTPREKMVTAPHTISIEDARALLHRHRIEKLPLLDGDRVVGLVRTRDLKKLEIWSKATRDSEGRLRVAAAVGIKDAFERGKALVAAGADVLVVDIAHGHSDHMVECIRMLKKEFSVDVLAGNIATAEAAEALIAAGVDGLKVGVGPSSVCTTRIMSGAGMPQLTAIINVASVAQKHGVPVCADGGISYPGDVVKAIAAGASSCMIGRLFAGTDEAPGLIISKEGRKYKQYYGSASFESAVERKQRIDGRTVKEQIESFVEGVATLVEYKGPVRDVIMSLVRGLQSGISYGGAQTIAELQKNAEFVEITPHGWRESLSRGIR